MFNDEEKERPAAGTEHDELHDANASTEESKEVSDEKSEEEPEVEIPPSGSVAIEDDVEVEVPDDSYKPDNENEAALMPLYDEARTGGIRSLVRALESMGGTKLDKAKEMARDSRDAESFDRWYAELPKGVREKISKFKG